MEPLPQSALLERCTSFSPVESLLCSLSLLLGQTNSIGSDLTSSAERVNGEGVRLHNFSLEETPLVFVFEPLPLPLTFSEEPLP